MERFKEFGRDILNPIFTLDNTDAQDEKIVELAVVKKVEVVMTKKGVDRKITMEEVEAHSSEAEPWFVVDGEVYDGTGFLKKHPGGAESITIVAGQDATEDFHAIHSPVSLHHPFSSISCRLHRIDSNRKALDDNSGGESYPGRIPYWYSRHVDDCHSFCS